MTVVPNTFGTCAFPARGERPDVSTASATVSRWSRGFVAASAAWLVCWQIAALAGAGRRVEIPLALYGFVLHVVFGKAYSLVPAYFGRTLAVPRAPAVHLPLAVAGVVGLAAGQLAAGQLPAAGTLSTVGGVSWALGVAVFLGTIAWTVRDNPTGAETGTGEHNADRRRVDRLANAALPVAMLYLGAGAYATAAGQTPLPFVFDGYPPRASHLLAAGMAALLLFAVGFRLLPRFLVAEPPVALVAVVLPAGALGPLLLAVGLPGGTLLQVGAILETVAVAGFALTYAILYRRTERDRLAFDGTLAGVVGGVLTVAFGVVFAFVGSDPDLVAAHYRLALLGFLGLTIVGVSYQFYPPSVADFPLAGDRLAGAVFLALGGGLLLEVAGLAGGLSVLVLAGRGLGVLGATGHASLLWGLFVQRSRS